MPPGQPAAPKLLGDLLVDERSLQCRGHRCPRPLGVALLEALQLLERRVGQLLDELASLLAGFPEVVGTPS
jgi:hypothetical protein